MAYITTQTVLTASINLLLANQPCIEIAGVMPVSERMEATLNPDGTVTTDNGGILWRCVKPLDAEQVSFTASFTPPVTRENGTPLLQSDIVKYIAEVNKNCFRVKVLASDGTESVFTEWECK